eukprot:gene4924-8512_t
MKNKLKKKVKQEILNTKEYIIAAILKNKHELVFYEAHPFKLVLKTGQSVSCFANLPNGNFITGSHWSRNFKFGLLTIWNFETLKIEKEITLSKVQTIHQIMVINEDKIIVAGELSRNEYVLFYISLEDSVIIKSIQTLDVYPCPIILIDSNTFSTPSGSFNEISYWNLEDSRPEIKVVSTESEIESYCLLHGGDEIVTSGQYYTVFIWNRYTSSINYSFKTIEFVNQIKTFQKNFLLTHETNAWRIYNPKNGKKMKEFPHNNNGSCFDKPHGDSTLFITDSNQLKIYDFLVDKVTHKYSISKDDSFLSILVLRNANYTIFKRKLHIKENILESEDLFDTNFKFE